MSSMKYIFGCSVSFDHEEILGVWFKHLVGSCFYLTVWKWYTSFMTIILTLLINFIDFHNIIYCHFFPYKSRNMCSKPLEDECIHCFSQIKPFNILTRLFFCHDIVIVSILLCFIGHITRALFMDDNFHPPLAAL